MSTNEIASKLIEYCRKGDFTGAHEALYADHCVSIEPKGSPAELVEGMDAIRQKGQQFEEMIEEVHEYFASDPLVADHFITTTMGMDVTFKGAPRMKIEEVGVFEVRDGKIVKEQFFFTPMPQG